ncbi:MAG: hypothetical protein ABIV51_13025 [Saprospiraceae bacterium]
MSFLQSNSIDISEFSSNCQIAINWVHRSIQVNGGKGSSAYYHLLKGWSKPYPETSGYLIETLMSSGEEKDRKAALGLGEWLLRIQTSSGAFPGGLGTHGKPIFFDSGMILGGLNCVHQFDPEGPWLSPLRALRVWLIQQLREPSDTNFVSGYDPTYQVLVLSRLLDSDKLIPISREDLDLIKATFSNYLKRINELSFPTQSGFLPDADALTHTLAYSLEGILKCGLFFENEKAIQVVKNALNQLIKKRRELGFLPATIDHHWASKDSYCCVVGNCQLSLLMNEMYRISNENHFLDAAVQLFVDVAQTAKRRMFVGKNAGVPGSTPIYGAYFRFAFPNWAAKYYIDAFRGLSTRASAK